MPTKAGHDLDLLVAEKVMGWKIHSREEMEAYAKEVWKDQPQCRFFGMMGFSTRTERDGSISYTVECQQYSTLIEQAWRVQERVERLMRLEYLGDGVWMCEFLGAQPGQEDVIAKAETAPLAICLAALRAAEQKESVHGDR